MFTSFFVGVGLFVLFPGHWALLCCCVMKGGGGGGGVLKGGAYHPPAYGC